MSKRILVPLDLTVEAEAVLPLVADAARGGGGAVRLLHVAPFAENVVDADGRVVVYADQEMTRFEAEATDYFSTIEAKLDGIPVEGTVRFGDPVDEILLEADRFGPELIVLSTRGSHPLTRLVLGSTADQICRRTEAPVVIFRPARDPAACR